MRIALISGGMYDRLYARIPQFEQATGVTVEVEFTGTHPELNAHLAALDHVPYDLVSTHTKYAPSQQRFLAPLEGFDTGDFFPSLLRMAEIGGALYGIPRNIDLRLLHYRTDLIETPPANWDELVEVAGRTTRAPQLYGFVFTGMESGLFGTFFELAESAGARIFPPSLLAEVDNEGGRWALGVLRELYASGAVPEAVAGWHYDEVHQFFRAGNAAMVCDWPGYYGSYRERSSAVRGRFRVARMPAGPTGRICCYAGSHTFALTRSGAEKESARELLRFLTAPEQQTLEARHGSVPVRRQVMAEQQQAAQGDEADRMALLAGAIEHDLIIPPKLPYYPEIEDILWRNVRSAMTGETAIADALVEIERRIGRAKAHR
jgi:multiple sugar transport system substrate-binding protein